MFKQKLLKWVRPRERKKALHPGAIELYSLLRREHEDFICAYAAKLMRTEQDAKTLVSDVWYILLQKSEEIMEIADDPVRTRSYIGRVINFQAQRIGRDFAVRNKYDALYRQLNEREGTAPGAGEEAECRIRQQQFMQAVQKLPEKYRNVILMRYFEGKANGEIAAALKISPTSVNQYAKRAREKLKEILIEDGIAEKGYDYE